MAADAEDADKSNSRKSPKPQIGRMRFAPRQVNKRKPLRQTLNKRNLSNLDRPQLYCSVRDTYYFRHFEPHFAWRRASSYFCHTGLLNSPPTDWTG